MPYAMVGEDYEVDEDDEVVDDNGVVKVNLMQLVEVNAVD